MASFYLRTRTGLAFKKAGQRHAMYIAGVGLYADKDEVVFVADKNLPNWAKNADDFFNQADKNERANGRSYRSLVFAIPNEASDKAAWAEAFTQALLADRHAYRLAVHVPKDGHNPHAHLMFSERGQTDRQAKDYFSRKNAKDKQFSGSKSKHWLETAKWQYLTLIRTLCPSYKPPDRGEPKVGIKLNGASNRHDEARKCREALVDQLRQDEQELQSLEAQMTEAVHVQTRRPVFTSGRKRGEPQKWLTKEEVNAIVFVPKVGQINKLNASHRDQSTRPKFK